MNGRRDWQFIILLSLATPVLLGLVFFIGARSAQHRGLCLVLAVQDADCDGTADWVTDRRLPGVCVWGGASPRPPAEDYCQNPAHQTGEDGRWLGAREGRSVVVQPPEGFAPTSDTVQRCTGGMFASAHFSFAPAGACPPRDVVTAEEQYRQRIAGYAVAGAVVAALVGALVWVMRRTRVTRLNAG